MGFGDGAPVVICCIDALVASSFLPLVVLVAMHMYTDMYTQSCRTTGIALQRFRPVIAGPGPRRGVARMPAACGACGCRGGRREPCGRWEMMWKSGSLEVFVMKVVSLIVFTCQDPGFLGMIAWGLGFLIIFPKDWVSR